MVNYAVWKHTTSSLKLFDLYVYILTDIFLITSVLQCLIVLYQNINLDEGHSQALISKHHDIIRMSIDVSRPLNIKVKQYVNIWVPSVNFWSFVQSHPLTIAFWMKGEEDTTLDLMIESRKEFTQQLFACAEHYLKSLKKFQNTGSDEKNLSDHVKNYQNLLEKGVVEVVQSKFSYKSFKCEPQVFEFCLALFSESHNMSIPVNEYEKVLMIAAESDIIAQLPYLKELVCGFNNFQVRTQKIQLI